MYIAIDDPQCLFRLIHTLKGFQLKIAKIMVNEWRIRIEKNTAILHVIINFKNNSTSICVREDLKGRILSIIKTTTRVAAFCNLSKKSFLLVSNLF